MRSHFFKNFCALLVTLLAVSANAQTRSFPSCSAWQGRVDLDGFCPRMEGVHLEGCCPPIEKRPGLSCNYHIVKARGQAFLGNSSYNACVGGQNVAIPCCEIQQRACFVSPVNLTFIPQLIGRNNQCCFEPCPPASYWRAEPNPNPSITPEHELTGAGMAMCTNTTLSECSLGSAPSCPTSSYCPVPETPTVPSNPNNPTDPGTPTNTDPGTPSTPSTPTNSDPGPSTPTSPPAVDTGNT